MRNSNESTEPNEGGRIPVKLSNSIDFNWGRMKISWKSAEFFKFKIFRFFTVGGINSLTGILGREKSRKFNSNWLSRENILKFSFSWGGRERKFLQWKNSSSLEISNEEIKNRKFREILTPEVEAETETEPEPESESESESESEIESETEIGSAIEPENYLKKENQKIWNIFSTF